MNRSLIKRVSALAVVTIIAICIMFKVESHEIQNSKEIKVTRENVREEEQVLDSLRTLRNAEEVRLENIKEEKSYLQKLPAKSEIKKIKFN